MDEATLSSAVPPVVKPFVMIRRRYPATLTGIVDQLKKYKRTMIKKSIRKRKPDATRMPATS